MNRERASALSHFSGGIMGILSYKKLWEVQLVEWPNSIRLTTGQMLDWAMQEWDGADCSYNLYTRSKLMSLALTTQYRSCVFYITSKDDGCIGCRWGLLPWEYQSGFGRANLEDDGRLVITSDFG
jgi:hypothetical protein